MMNVTIPASGIIGVLMKALLFDFDGLLMDTESTEVQIWREIYAEHGAEFPLDIWLQKVVGSTDENFDPVAHLSSLTGKDLDSPSIRQEARRIRLERQSVLTAQPGVNAMLAAAQRAGLRQVIVSSSPHWWVDGYLEQLGITPFFEHVVCREDVARVKPAPDLYLEAVRRLELPADECLAFEDSPNGVRSARSARLKVVGVPNPITAQAGPLPADLLLSSLAELPLEELLENFSH
jgi:HAD superfamily hydrolase (TIGR01509 family)